MDLTFHFPLRLSQEHIIQTKFSVRPLYNQTEYINKYINEYLLLFFIVMPDVICVCLLEKYLSYGLFVYIFPCKCLQQHLKVSPPILSRVE